MARRKKGNSSPQNLDQLRSLLSEKLSISENQLANLLPETAANGRSGVSDVASAIEGLRKLHADWMPQSSASADLYELTKYQADEISTGNGDALCWANRWIIREELGGGMAETFLVRDINTDNLRVLKRCPDPSANPSVNKQRFIREIDVLKKLPMRPFLPELVDANIVDDVPYYIMEYVAGPNVQDRLQHLGPGELLPLADAYGLMRTLTEAVICLHSFGVRHRDIKPANVIYTDERVVLVDFGLARSDESSSITVPGGRPMLTPEYASPQHWEGLDRVKYESDIYSLGCTFFFIVTGYPPFGERPQVKLEELKRLHDEEPPPDLREERFRGDFRVEDIDSLADLILTMMSKQANDRPTAAAVLSRIHALAPTVVNSKDASSQPVRRINRLSRKQPPGFADLVDKYAHESEELASICPNYLTNPVANTSEFEFRQKQVGELHEHVLGAWSDLLKRWKSSAGDKLCFDECAAVINKLGTFQNLLGNSSDYPESFAPIVRGHADVFMRSIAFATLVYRNRGDSNATNLVNRPAAIRVIEAAYEFLSDALTRPDEPPPDIANTRLRQLLGLQIPGIRSFFHLVQQFDEVNKTHVRALITESLLKGIGVCSAKPNSRLLADYLREVVEPFMRWSTLVLTENDLVKEMGEFASQTVEQIFPRVSIGDIGLLKDRSLLAELLTALGLRHHTKLREHLQHNGASDNSLQFIRDSFQKWERESYRDIPFHTCLKDAICTGLEGAILGVENRSPWLELCTLPLDAMSSDCILRKHGANGGVSATLIEIRDDLSELTFAINSDCVRFDPRFAIFYKDDWIDLDGAVSLAIVIAGAGSTGKKAPKKVTLELSVQWGSQDNDGHAIVRAQILRKISGPVDVLRTMLFERTGRRPTATAVRKQSVSRTSTDSLRAQPAEID